MGQDGGKKGSEATGEKSGSTFYIYEKRIVVEDMALKIEGGCKRRGIRTFTWYIQKVSEASCLVVSNRYIGAASN